MLGRGGFIDDADAAFISGLDFALRCDVELLRHGSVCCGELQRSNICRWIYDFVRSMAPQPNVALIRGRNDAESTNAAFVNPSSGHG